MISPTATSVKTFYYKGAYTDRQVEFEIIGYSSTINSPGCIHKYYESVYILVNDEIHSILPEYLKQMQSSKFNRFIIDKNEE